MITLLVIVAALLLDRWLGEPSRGHPLVLFGKLADRAEGALYGPDALPPRQRRLRGLASLALIVAIPTLITARLVELLPFPWLLETLGLYLCLGRQSLVEHARAIAMPLVRGDLDQARTRTGYIVSRNTATLNEHDISKAAVESVLENGNDACFATLFWFAVGGLPGALLHRLVNTLDAMWGYRNDRYRYFGWAAARLDDLLAWVPARLCALAYALVGATGDALACWQRQAPGYDSPNGGPVMASGAGALGVELGGAAVYEGRVKQRPVLGCGRPVAPQDIERALALVDRALLLWLFGSFCVFYWFAG